ncbi:hypothetical protein MTO96_002048 [Rhipicephalus appendiculatus]
MRSPQRQAAREKHSAALAAAVKAASGLTAQRSLSVTLPVRLASPEQWVLGAPPLQVCGGAPAARATGPNEEAIAPARQATPNCITFSPAGARARSFSPSPRGLARGGCTILGPLCWGPMAAGTNGRASHRATRIPGPGSQWSVFPLSLLFWRRFSFQRHFVQRDEGGQEIAAR